MTENKQSNISLYRRFFLTGGIRVVTGRSFSLIYTIIVARLIAKDIIGIMVVLASLQVVLLVASTYGTRYSSVHFSLGRKKVENGDRLPIHLSVLLGVPTIIFLTELVFLINHFVFPSNSLNTIAQDITLHGFYLLSNVLVITLEGFILAQRAALRSDREETLRLSYSVFNSILVPLIFYFHPVLLSILYAWNLALFLSLILGWFFYPKKATLFSISLHELKDMLAFGFVVNLATILATISKYFDKFAIYARYTEAQLSEYYWGNRIATILFEIFQVSLTGVYPLLTKIQQDQGTSAVKRSFTALFKLGILTSALLFGTLGLFADLAVFILLGDQYQNTIIILQLFSFSMWLFSINAILYTRLNSSGSRKLLVQATLLSSVVRVVVLSIASLYSIHALTVGFGIAAFIISLYILSMHKIILLDKKTVTLGYVYGLLVLITFNGVYFLFPLLWIRIVLAPFILLSFISLAYLTHYISDFEISLIKRVLKIKS